MYCKCRYLPGFYSKLLNVVGLSWNRVFRLLEIVPIKMRYCKGICYEYFLYTIVIFLLGFVLMFID